MFLSPNILSRLVEQLAAIKKVTMSRVICENVFVEKIQPAAFKMQSEEASESG